jgi:tRNA(Ile2) C34 agmatinyltransferase TiaS
MSGPACPDCGAQMQHVAGMWRCPWASTERQGRAKEHRLHVVTCAWPLTVPRKVAGLPDPDGEHDWAAP